MSNVVHSSIDDEKTVPRMAKIFCLSFWKSPATPNPREINASPPKKNSDRPTRMAAADSSSIPVGDEASMIPAIIISKKIKPPEIRLMMKDAIPIPECF